jgi:hypothetical protein
MITGENMAHFAQLNEENLVTQVIVVANQDTADQDGVENEAIGIEFCTNLLGGKWVQTSYNANIRKNYAGVGYKYDAALDAFIPPQPFASWTLNNETAQWEAPTPYPTDDKRYTWDEATTAWVEVPVGE